MTVLPSRRLIQVTAVVDTLIADFNDVPRVDWCVFVIGEKYFVLAQQMESQRLVKMSDEHYRKAIGVWQRIIDVLDPGAYA